MHDIRKLNYCTFIVSEPGSAKCSKCNRTIKARETDTSKIKRLCGNRKVRKPCNCKKGD